LKTVKYRAYVDSEIKYRAVGGKMKNRFKSLLVLLPVFGALSIYASQAQTPQQFLPNTENNIQNDISSGAINPSQAQQLQNRASQIQNQELQDMSRQGGALTPQQQAQINRETAGLNRRANRDVHMDNPNLNTNWRPQFQPQGGFPNFNGQNNANWQQLQQERQLQAQQWLQSHPNAQQYAQNNPYHHHHHGQWNGENGQNGQPNNQWNGQNGQWNGQNPQFNPQNNPYNR